MTTWLIDRGGLLAIAVLALYVWLAPEHIVYGDNAEFSGLSVLGGAAHPTGYPLYVMWLRLWSWLPAASPAHASSIATAILVCLQALSLHAGCRAWGARPLAASLAVALFAGGPIAMRIHSEAEVFAMNGLVVAVILWLAGVEGPLRGGRRVVGLALVAGIGLTNHMTCALAAPIGIYGVVCGVRESTGPRLPIIAAGVAAFLVGLLPYVYLLVTPETACSWGKVSDLHGLVRHILRSDYGSPGQFSPHATTAEVAVGKNMWVFVQSVGRAYLYLPALVGLCAVGVLAVRSKQRVAWILFAVSWLLAGPVLALRFNVRPEGVGLYVTQRFHLMTLGMLAVPVAVGLDHSAERLHLKDRVKIRRSVHALVVLLVYVAAASRSLDYVRRGHSPVIEQALVNELVTLPPGAIVIGAPDEFHFGLNYLQGALGVRPDVATIAIPQLGLPHYRERVRLKTGIVVTNAPGLKLSINVASQALETGRPVFIDPYMANIAQHFPTYPYGILFRVLPVGSALPSIEDVFAMNKHLFELYELGYARPGPDDQLATQYYTAYARLWTVLAEALGRADDREDAAFSIQMANALEPRDP